MTDAELITYWLVGVGVFAVVILLAALLLIAILLEAKRIERGALTALQVVTKIDDNTDILWKLEDTNHVAQQLSAGAEAILGNAGAVATALHDADMRRGATSSRMLPEDARGA